MYAEEGTTPPEGGYQVLTFKRRKGKEVHRESTRWPCPHCEHLCTIRTSNMMTKTMRETTYICSNPECACSFVVNSQIHRMLNVGATPDPSINIPLSSHVRRDVVRAMLDHAEEAAHQPRYTKPVTGDLFMDSPVPDCPASA